MTAQISEAIEIRLPHTRRQYAEPRSEPLRPFAGRGSRLPTDLVAQLLAAGDKYDARLAYVLAVIAGWSYSDADTLANKLRYYELPKISVDAIAVTNPAMLIVASAFIVRSECGRLGMLAFRGTEPANVINWLTDTDVTQRSLGRGCVHQGFYANLEAVWDEIYAKVDEAMHGESRARADGRPQARLERLYVTGHSLGGAMAVLAAAKLASDPRLEGLVRGVYTFGQPAVGNREFADDCQKLFGKRLFRHVFAYDVVPHLPPVWDDRFVHFGSALVTARTTDKWTPAKGPVGQARWLLPALASCATSFLTRRLPLLEQLPLPYSLDDHSPARYIEASRTSVPRARGSA